MNYHWAQINIGRLVAPQWEINFGVGVGVMRSTDHLIAKMILGYRFDF